MWILNPREFLVALDIYKRIQFGDYGTDGVYEYDIWPECKPWEVMSYLNKWFKTEKFTALYNPNIVNDKVVVLGPTFGIWDKR